MLSSDQIQCLLLHRLWIDRNSRHRISADHFQLFSLNAVRSACLHCKLFQFRQIKAVPDCSEKAIQLSRLQCRRSSSTDIHCIRFPLSRHPAKCFQFLDQCIQIGIYLIFPLADRRRTERTVGTDTRTKRNPDIKAESFAGIQLSKLLLFPARNLISKFCLFFRNTVFFLQELPDLYLIQSGFQFLHHKFRRSDSRKHPPRQFPVAFL